LLGVSSVVTEETPSKYRGSTEQAPKDLRKWYLFVNVNCGRQGKPA